MFYPGLVDKNVIFSAAAASGRCFCCSRCPFAVISDYGRYFEMIFAVCTGHVSKAPSLIDWSRVSFLGGRGLDDKIAKY